MPIAAPFVYAIYLAKMQGPYATLGLAEDTWALNERVVDEEAFLEQACCIYDERETMFFDALEKTKHGLRDCVFDTSDRIQPHVLPLPRPDHPANRARTSSAHEDVIPSSTGGWTTCSGASRRLATQTRC